MTGTGQVPYQIRKDNKIIWEHLSAFDPADNRFIKRHINANFFFFTLSKSQNNLKHIIKNIHNKMHLVMHLTKKTYYFNF